MNVVSGHLWCSLDRVCRAFSWGVASISKGKSRSVFSAAVSKIQASKCYIESLPLVLKDRRRQVEPMFGWFVSHV